jgi:hypothetical protein
MLEGVLVILLVLAFLMVAYKGAVHEFQILQKDWKPTIDWSTLLGEQLPLVIRNVEPTWQGSWTRKTTAQKTWPIQVRKDGKLMRGRWNEWLQNPGQPPLTSETVREITAFAAPPLPLWEDGGFRRWPWIPAHLTHSSCRVLGPGVSQPVRRTTAAMTLVQATDGAPLTIWLAHEGAIPAKVIPAVVGRDPWSLTHENVPWISEMKFIEMRLRPGNAVAIPTHWFWAARAEGEEGVGVMGDGGWFWIAEFQTPVSWLVSRVKD